MLNKPKYMMPSTNLQECTIDLNADKILFSCIVDGNEAVYAWRLRIYRLSDNVKVYDTGKIVYTEGVTLVPSLPFYSVNEKNQSVVFKVNLKQYPTIDVPLKDSSGNTISPVPNFQNDKEPYYWTIEFWNSLNIDKDVPTVVSCEEAFYANSIPGLTIKYKKNSEGDECYTNFPDNGYDTATFTANGYTFKASYSQLENVPLKRYGWRLTDIDSGQVLLDTITKNQIYGTSENILCSYDGFLNNGNYSIELYIETQNNVMITTIPTPFAVSYQTTFLTNDFTTEVLLRESAVRNSWENAKTIEGTSSADEDDYISNYPIVGNGTTAIKIHQGETITYDYGSTSNMDITEDSYIVLSTQLLSANDTDLFFAEGIDRYGNIVVRKLSFESGVFKYSISDFTGSIITETFTPSDGYKPNRYVWYVITMAPCSAGGNLLTVVESRAVNGIYPSKTLYPSTSLYPSFGEWVTKTSEEANE